MNLAHDMREDYTALDLLPGASLEEVKAAYRRLARALHPDLNPGAAGLLMGRINRAYQSISRHLAGEQTPSRPPAGPWTPYHYEDFTSRAGHGAPKPPRSAPAPEPRAGHAAPSPQGPLSALDDQDMRPRPGPAPLSQDPQAGWRLMGIHLEGRDVVYEVEVQGNPRVMNLPVRCQKTCPHCQGAGRLFLSQGPGPCPHCGGRGSITRANQVRVDLPPAWRPGQRLDIPACSQEGRMLVELRRPAQGRV